MVITVLGPEPDAPLQTGRMWTVYRDGRRETRRRERPEGAELRLATGAPLTSSDAHPYRPGRPYAGATAGSLRRPVHTILFGGLSCDVSTLVRADWQQPWWRCRAPAPSPRWPRPLPPRPPPSTRTSGTKSSPGTAARRSRWLETPRLTARWCSSGPATAAPTSSSGSSSPAAV